MFNCNYCLQFKLALMSGTVLVWLFFAPDSVLHVVGQQSVLSHHLPVSSMLAALVQSTACSVVSALNIRLMKLKIDVAEMGERVGGASLCPRQAYVIHLRVLASASTSAQRIGVNNSPISAS